MTKSRFIQIAATSATNIDEPDTMSTRLFALDEDGNIYMNEFYCADIGISTWTGWEVVDDAR